MTSNSLYLEVEHCHAVCAELRAQITALKEDRVTLAKEVDDANDRSGELAAQVQQLTARAETFRKALLVIATCGENTTVNGLRQYASGFLELGGGK